MMNRAEFMKILRSELRRLPEDERNSALEYYEEYFDEAGPQKEQQVLENLGNPKKIAGQIKEDYAMQQLDQEEMPTAKKGWSAFKWAIVGICSAPISIPVAIVLVCVAVAAFITFVGCAAGVIAGIVGAAAASIAFLVLGVLAFPAAVSTGIMLLGIGLAGLGVSALLGWLVVWGSKLLFQLPSVPSSGAMRNGRRGNLNKREMRLTGRIKRRYNNGKENEKISDHLRDRSWRRTASYYHWSGSRRYQQHR